MRACLESGRSFDDEFAAQAERHPDLPDRDRAFARLVAITVLRRRGEIGAVLDPYFERPLPTVAGPAAMILAVAAAQLLFLGTPAHAAIDRAVAAADADNRSRPFAKLANAVLRKVAKDGPEKLVTGDAAVLNTPDWLWHRWVAHYGEPVAREMAAAHLAEPPLDLTLTGDAPEDLIGTALNPATLRLPQSGRVTNLPGFASGAAFVQDYAASWPARLLGGRPGERIADLCAAPGGKTAQLVLTGADIIAVDSSVRRLDRLRENMSRMGFAPQIIAADATDWHAGDRLDAVLLDAPCTATGTLRRHPDAAHLKRRSDLADLTDLQTRLADNAVRLLKPGGRLVYAVCSLEPEEGEEQARRLMERGGLVPDPIRVDEVCGESGWLTPEGWLRLLPHFAPPLMAGGHAEGGMDGFFAARFRRA